MNKRKSGFALNGDLERPHPTVADTVGGGLGAEPLPVKLGDIWSDFIKGGDEASDSGSPRDPRPHGSVPLIDDMKGIRQWD